MRFIYNFEVFYLHKLLLALEFNGKITRIMITIWLQMISCIFGIFGGIFDMHITRVEFEMQFIKSANVWLRVNTKAWPSRLFTELHTAQNCI